MDVSGVKCSAFFLVSLTRENVCRVFSDMLSSWKVDKANNVRMIIRDSAANMVKAMKDGGYSHILLVLHTHYN